MKATIKVTSPIVKTARVTQMQGLYDVPVERRSERQWEIDMPLDERDWNIGAIIGPSGSGKSTIARKMFASHLHSGFTWEQKKSILDGFPSGLSIKEIVELLFSVGFSSPPAWVRPFQVLSTGEQFRVTLARLLAESRDLAVMDEYTSVVDRTVAKIGSAALSKTVRRRNQKFIAVTCHEDVEDWLQPDWVYRTDINQFQWRLLRRRPEIRLEISRVHNSAWKLFSAHHYLTAHLNKAAVCFCAFWNNIPVAFHSWLPFVGKLKDQRQARRGSRTVCLPDYQGVGIGHALMQLTASMWKGLGYRAFSTSAHPAEIAAKRKSPFYKIGKFGMNTSRRLHIVDRTRATDRILHSFEYIGPSMPFQDAFNLLHSMDNKAIKVTL